MTEATLTLGGVDRREKGTGKDLIKEYGVATD